MATLFVYGTLQHHPVIEALLGRIPDMRPAEVAGHRAAPLSGRVYPGLLPDESATAVGHVFDADDGEVSLLDRFEGPEYERRTVTATTGDGVVECQAWVLVGSSRRLARPGAWSFERFVAEHAEEFLGGSRPDEPHPGAGPA